METIKPLGVPKALGPYSVAKIYNGIGFISGQTPINS